MQVIIFHYISLVNRTVFLKLVFYYSCEINLIMKSLFIVEWGLYERQTDVKDHSVNYTSDINRSVLIGCASGRWPVAGQWRWW